MTVSGYQKISSTPYLVQEKQRKGCPTVLSNLYQTSFEDDEPLVHNYTTLALSHISKLGEIKNFLKLDEIHHELEIDAYALRGSGSSNILLSKVSFDCLVTGSSGKATRDYIIFDLRIPSINQAADVVCSYDSLEKEYGTKSNVYRVMKYFYTQGRNLVNQRGHKHGHCPDYDPSSSSHDQYIRHTEQLLVAYLALPKASEMLCNRLRTVLRAKYSDVAAVKVYNIGLHLHSTKRCCAPCENALIGMMNQREAYVLPNHRSLGLIPNFLQFAAQANEQLEITFPERSLFRLIVTVTADTCDADHKALPLHRVIEMRNRHKIPRYTIDVKDPQSSNHIFTTLLGNIVDERKCSLNPKISHITVGISGSNATPGSSKTKAKVLEIRNEELYGKNDTLTRMMSLLKVISLPET